MRAEEFLNELKIVDRMLSGKELPAAARLFQNIKHKFDDDHQASVEVAKMVGIRPRLLQNHLIDNGLMESDLM